MDDETRKHLGMCPMLLPRRKKKKKRENERENLSTRLSEQRKLRQRQSAGPHTSNWAAAEQTGRGGGAEESKGKPARAGGCGMALRALWPLWLLGCCWSCGDGRGAGRSAAFARTGPRSREQQAAAFRVPTARLPVCLLLALSFPESGLGQRGPREMPLLLVPLPAVL